MILAFTLTMPGVGSWNGKWSGEGRLFAKVVNLGRSKQAEINGIYILAAQPYRYTWDDGWSARITVTKIDAKEAARMRRLIRKANEGFCGYDWMVNSIIHYGDIRILPQVQCDKCGKVRIEDNWIVPEEDALKFIKGFTTCPDCARTVKPC